MTIKRLLTLLFAFSLAACSPKVTTITETWEQSRSSKDIIILYENDVHCHLEKYPVMAAMKKDMLEFFKYVAVVSSGDFSQGGPLGAYTKGESVIKVMNEVGYDVVTLGNHEFDYGFPQLYKNTGGLDAEVVDCNLIDLRNGNTLFKPYTIKNFGGTKIAFIGVSTPNTMNSSTPTFFQDDKGNFIYGFCTDSLYRRVQNTVDEVIRKGADYVIALTHIGVAEDIPGLSSYKLAAATYGIDVILDGHSHTTILGDVVKNKKGDSMIITQTGSYLNNIGRLTITPDGEVISDLISTDAYTKKDARTAAFVDSLTEEYDKESNRLAATVAFPMIAADDNDNRPPRYMEMPLGDLCADAFREITGADIALHNGGNIRSGFTKDEILFSDIFAMMPFQNHVQVAEIPGRVILDALEFSVALTPESFGGFLQVSGLKFEADLSVKSGVKCTDDNMFKEIKGKARRIRNVLVLDRNDGLYKPLDPDRLYKVASTSYILSQSGNGYTMFAPYARNAAEMDCDCNILEKYLKENLGGVIPDRYREAQGRIILLPAE